MKAESTKRIAETDLYQPIADWLLAQGYTVRSEVRNCDITAVRGEDLIMVELKRSFGASLLIQAIERQKITDSVYVALPRPRSGVRGAQWRGMEHLLRRLELGLILVSFGAKKPAMDVVFHPTPFERKRRKSAKRAVLREMEGRTGDFNQGGCTRRKIMTAYRENVVHVACCLEKFGPLAPRQLRALGTGQKTLSILRSNFYGWFERVDRGIYNLKPRGSAELEQHPELAGHYRAMVAGLERPR